MNTIQNKSTQNEKTPKENSEYVQIQLEDGDSPWIGGINGTFYRISRGIPVSVPVRLANLISQNERISILAEKTVAAYKTPEGKFLKGNKK